MPAKKRDRNALVVRLEPEMLKKVERLTRRSRREMGGSWSRNDQIAWMLKMYEAPEDQVQPEGDHVRGR